MEVTFPECRCKGVLDDTYKVFNTLGRGQFAK